MTNLCNPVKSSGIYDFYKYDVRTPDIYREKIKTLASVCNICACSLTGAKKPIFFAVIAQTKEPIGCIWGETINNIASFDIAVLEGHRHTKVMSVLAGICFEEYNTKVDGYDFEVINQSVANFLTNHLGFNLNSPNHLSRKPFSNEELIRLYRILRISN